MTTSEIDTAWPLWATTVPDEIRRLLLPEQWGPWGGTFRCINSNFHATEGALVSHYAEPPHFFYCEAHLAAVRKSRGTTKPWAARDQGLCISCRKPAERKKPVPMQFRVACVEAERTNATVARLMTNGYCQSCNPRIPTNSRCAEVGFAARTNSSAGSYGRDAATSPGPADVATVPNAAPPLRQICLLRSCRPPQAQLAPPLEEKVGMNVKNGYETCAARASTIEPSPTDWVFMSEPSKGLSRTRAVWRQIRHDSQTRPGLSTDYASVGGIIASGGSLGRPTPHCGPGAYPPARILTTQQRW